MFIYIYIYEIDNPHFIEGKTILPRTAAEYVSHSRSCVLRVKVKLVYVTLKKKNL